ncbi:hypothetical protein [Trueperella pyogenes]
MMEKIVVKNARLAGGGVVLSLLLVLAVLWIPSATAHTAKGLFKAHSNSSLTDLRLDGKPAESRGPVRSSSESADVEIEISKVAESLSGELAGAKLKIEAVRGAFVREWESGEKPAVFKVKPGEYRF